MNRRCLLAVTVGVLLLVATGCATERTASGFVHSSVPYDAYDATGDIYGDGEPLEEAQIEYVCRDRRPRTIAVTDEEGRFHYNGDGTWHRDCSFRVSRRGFHNQEFDVQELCQDIRGDYCTTIAIQAELLDQKEARSADDYTAPRASGPRRGQRNLWVQEHRRWRLMEGAMTFAAIQTSLGIASYLTRWPVGGYIMGGFQLFAGLTVAMESKGRAGGALLALASFGVFAGTAFYNFRYAPDLSTRTNFLVNMGGWNLGLLSVAASHAVSEAYHNYDGAGAGVDSAPPVQVGFTGSGVFFQYRF